MKGTPPGGLERQGGGREGTHSRMSVSVMRWPNQYGPSAAVAARCASALSSASNSAVTLRSYASCVVANPLLYTPLLILSYVHSPTSSIAARSGSG